MSSIARRTRVAIREFICQTGGHKLKFVVRAQEEISSSGRVPKSAEFKSLESRIGRTDWFPIPVCHCGSICDELEFYNPGLLSVPASERAMFWLSPDGQRLAVPGKNTASMPERYRRAGYVEVHAASFQDLDRFDSIRARQTGNDVANEMNYDKSTREFRREVTPDFDDENITKSEI